MKLYVGNLSFDTTENDLQELFEQFGTVKDVGLITDRATARSRGFAFVTMGSSGEGQAAIDALEGKPFQGRNLTVNEARPKEDRPFGGGGGGGGGRPHGGGGGGGRSFGGRGGGGGGGGGGGRRY
ncbi:MAG TPA: RNA-binding protein [Chthoniobacteraceae bacterium]|jgi:RNA recognition motif-containing protein|nr:RNA-binding protein [Chthoniobacteraceae bacterium]